MSKDRQTSEPGGCECMSCGAIFIGGPAHTECGECFAAREAMTKPPCVECGAMTETEAQQRCNAREHDCHGLTLWPH